MHDQQGLQGQTLRPQVDARFVWRVSSIAALGGVLYGYDMGIIAAALVFVTQQFQLSSRMQEVVVSVVLAGAMLGAVVGGVVADRIGRKRTLMWAAWIFLLGSALAPLAPDVWILVVARFVLGLAIGFTSVTAPVYVSELSAPETRGRLIGLYQLALTAGIALADLLGYWLATRRSWRWMFGLGALPALGFALLVLGLPESPRWLVAKGRRSEAEATLESYTDQAGAELLLADIDAGLAVPIDSRWSSLLRPAVRGALVVALGFTLLQQVCGINTVVYYGPKIFALAGVGSDRGAIFATLLVALTNVAATVVALLLVDRIGRKPLLYGGVGVMTASLLLLSAAFYHRLGPHLSVVATACLMIYIAAFAASMGPISWILVSEVFPLRVRARGVAVASLGSGLANLLVSATFLSLLQTAGSAATFALYAVACVAMLLFVKFVVPETMGRNLESISVGEASGRRA